MSEAKIRPAEQACSLDFRYRKIEKITVRIENRGFAEQPASTIHDFNTGDDPREEHSIQQAPRQSYSERRKLQVELRVTSRRQALPRPSCLVQRIPGRESRDQKFNLNRSNRCPPAVSAGGPCSPEAPRPGIRQRRRRPPRRPRSAPRPAR